METSARFSSPPGQDGQGRSGPQQPRASAFDPAVHLRTLEDGSEYLDARWRLVWFLGRHRKYIVASNLVHLSPRLAVVKVTITLPGGRSAQGLGMAAPHGVYRYVETAQTHALALLGFGTESALDLDTEAPSDGGVRRDGHKKEEATVDSATADSGGPDQQPPQEPQRSPKSSQELPSWASLERVAAEEDPQRTPDALLGGSKPAEGAIGQGAPIQCQECQGPGEGGQDPPGEGALAPGGGPAGQGANGQGPLPPLPHPAYGQGGYGGKETVKVIDVQAVKGRHRLEEVIEREGIPLRKEGAHLVARCPFHSSDNTPSFMVYLHTQSYFCFACQAWGDVIDFVRQRHGLTFREAVAFLEGQLASQGAGPVASPVPEVQVTEAHLEVLEKAVDHYQRGFEQSPQALHYLLGRGLTRGSIRAERLGYCGSASLA